VSLADRTVDQQITFLEIQRFREPLV